MKVIKVEVGKEPIVTEIDGSLRSLQDAVGGYITAIYPYSDPVGIVADDEGVLKGKKVNRIIKYENYEVSTPIVGDFLVVGLGEENFASIGDQYVDTYLEKLKNPVTYEELVEYIANN